MADVRQCPYCGEIVTSQSVNCPKCFRDIPLPEPPVERIGRKKKTKEEMKSKKVIFALSTIPAIFGLLGLGHIYQDYKDSRGWLFLAVGLFVYIGMVSIVFFGFGHSLFVTIVSSVLMVIAALVYISTFIAQLVDSYMGSLFQFVKC